MGVEIILVEAIESSKIDIAPSYDEYVTLAFAIATDYGEAGRPYFHRIRKLHQRYDSGHADRMYSSAVSINRGQTHIASAFYLAKKAGVNIDEVRIKRLEEEQLRREEAGKNEQKLANLQTCRGLKVPTRTYVHYNIDYDDEAFENTQADAEEPVSESAEPFSPLPLLLDDYRWPKPIDDILTMAENDLQRDALFLGIVDAIGSTLSPYVRTMYSGNWMYPNLQVFIVAPPASGKGMVSWCRYFVEPFHEKVRREYNAAFKEYEKKKKMVEQMGKAKAELEVPKLPPNKMFIISGDNSSTGIAQNVIESDGRAGNTGYKHRQNSLCDCRVATNRGAWVSFHPAKKISTQRTLKTAS